MIVVVWLVGMACVVTCQLSEGPTSYVFGGAALLVLGGLATVLTFG